VVGTRLALLSPATVSLKNKEQNTRFVQALSAESGESVTLTLPRGTVLTVDRVYIRQGDAPEYNSLTFKVLANQKAGIPSGRFFLHVDVVNTLDVEVVQDKPVPKGLTTRTLLSSLFKQCTSMERVKNIPFTLLMEQMNACPTVCEGSLVVDIQSELALLTQAVVGNTRSVGEESFDAFTLRIKSIVGKKKGQLLSEQLDIINAQAAIVSAAIQECAYEALYQFRAFRFNGESVIWLSPTHSWTAIRAIHAMESAYKGVFALLFYSRSEDFRKAGSLWWPSLFNQVTGASEHNNFGLYCRKNNYSPKSPIVNAEKTQALIPQDAFVDNIFTRTKKDDHGHDFLYRLSSGNCVSVADFRKMI
jgi:hypothetical protein